MDSQQPWRKWQMGISNNLSVECKALIRKPKTTPKEKGKKRKILLTDKSHQERGKQSHRLLLGIQNVQHFWTAT